MLELYATTPAQSLDWDVCKNVVSSLASAAKQLRNSIETWRTAKGFSAMATRNPRLAWHHLGQISPLLDSLENVVSPATQPYIFSRKVPDAHIKALQALLQRDRLILSRYLGSRTGTLSPEEQVLLGEIEKRFRAASEMKCAPSDGGQEGLQV
jgi:hypothetical protein